MRVHNRTDVSDDELCREEAAALVEQLFWSCGTKHEALELAAGEFGVGLDWLRKFIGQYPSSKVSLSNQNRHRIKAVYDRLCGTIERNAGALEHETYEGTTALRNRVERTS